MKLKGWIFSVVVVVASIAAVPSVASAQSVDHRLQKQEHRIDQGVKKGELTSRQARKLRANDRRVKVREHRAKAHHHGRLSATQRHRMNRRLNNNQSQNLRDKHDAAARGN